MNGDRSFLCNLDKGANWAAPFLSGLTSNSTPPLTIINARSLSFYIEGGVNFFWRGRPAEEIPLQIVWLMLQ
jgi:hypothetical protein